MVPPYDNFKPIASIILKLLRFKVVKLALFYNALKRFKLYKAKAVPLQATKALEGRRDIAPTHSRPRH
jgi:hypothetical protein